MTVESGEMVLKRSGANWQVDVRRGTLAAMSRLPNRSLVVQALEPRLKAIKIAQASEVERFRGTWQLLSPCSH